MNYRLLKYPLLTAVGAVLWGCMLGSEIQTPVDPGGTHFVRFTDVADAGTRTSLLEGDDVATFYWSEDDEKRLSVTENGVEAIDLTMVLSEDKRTATVLAEFANTSADGFEYRASLGTEVPATQTTSASAYDPSADVLVSNPVVKTTTGQTEELVFNFNRTAAISKMTLQGLQAGERVSEIKLTSDKDFIPGDTLTLCCDEVADSTGKASIFFVTEPVSEATFAIDVKTSAQTYSKTFASPVTLYAEYVNRLTDVNLGSAGKDPDPDPDPNPDPDPDPDPDPEVTSSKYPWYEMPLVEDKDGNGICDSDNTLYYALHYCEGGEKAPGGGKARNYVVCFSSEYHCPVWVAAPRHSMYVGSSGRNDSYKVDPDIPSSIQYYSKSVDSGCNKGHMLGSAERTSSVATNRQVFYYSNIAPQLSTGFNTGGGGWNLLEDWIDGKVCADTLYEVVGCYFDTFKDGYGYTVTPQTISFGGRNDVAFPTMFYYVLLRTKKGNSGKPLSKCTADELQCAAFVRAHTNSLKGQKPSAKEMMSVSDLEKITGFTYFTNVSQAPKSTFNASDWGL